mgnify:CR=1 FL=1
MADIEWNQEGAVARIKINRPERKNALGGDMRLMLAEAFDRANSDESIRAVLLEGEGDCFCAGADVSGMGNLSIIDSRARLQSHTHHMIKKLYAIEKPVIAVVRGPAVGMGLSMVLACDLTIASDTARFSCIFARRGLAPDTGAAFLLSRVIGHAKAKELIFTTRFFSAQEAKSLDIVTEVVEDSRLESHALEYAEKLARQPTFALGMAKKMLQFSLSPSFDQFLEYEALIQPLIHCTHDYKEGIDAFKENREARFTGR